MAQKLNTAKELQEAVDAAAKAGSAAAGAKLLGIPETTMKHRLKAAARGGVRPSIGEDEHLKARVKRLEADLANAQKKSLTEDAIRRHIIGLRDAVADAQPPAWMIKTTKVSDAPGVPTLFLSDLHWGEVVNPSQINGVNRYNIDIAKKRLRHLAERAVRLLGILSPKMDYPGIVVALGGDMISGNIHDELTATNEMNSMPCVLDLYGELVTFISGMADIFGSVFVPCVTGNHGRDTMKIWGKDRHHTSFDWLLYQFLAKRFESDKRVTFLIPDGPDAYYKVYNYRYLLTHGDQFRGGDSMIGALGPLTRGDHKKRSRNGQIDMSYETMICGHWHSYMHLARLIVNGSLKGYDEYAYSNNFGFEVPQQALWVNHQKHGITYRMPVKLDAPGEEPKTSWVSVAA